TFAARIAASSGSPLHACVATALNVHQGIAFDCDRLERFFRHSRTGDELAQTFGEYLRSGAQLAGFNHRFYQAGDPRAQLLVERAEVDSADPCWAAALRHGLEQIHQTFDAKPAIESG